MVGGKAKKTVETPTHAHTTHSQGIEDLKLLFPTWADEDLKAELQFVNNDFNAAVDRISSGQAEQWAEVGKKQKPKKSEPEPEQKKKDSSESHTNGSSARGRGRGASNTGTRGAPAGRGRSDRAAGPPPTRDSNQPARGTGRPSRGRADATSSTRPAEVVVVSSQDWDADTTTPAAPAINTSTTTTAAPAPVVNSWSNPIPPWSKPAVAQEPPQPAVESSPVVPAPAVAQEHVAQSASAPQPAVSEPQPSSYQFAAKAQAAPAPAPAVAVPQPQVQPQPQAQPQVQPVVAAPAVNPQAHIQQTSLRMPPTLVPTLEDVEKTLHDQAGFSTQPRMGGFAQKDNSPVVLPSNAAIQGLNLRFGSLGLGVEEPAPAAAAVAAAAPAVPQQNGTPAVQPISTEKTAERAPAGFSQPQKAPEAHQRPQAQRTEGTEAAYPGTTPAEQPAMFNSYMQNMPQYGMPMNYGFYDGLDVNMQQRMMYFDPAFQHSQHFQGPPVKGNYAKTDPATQSPQAVPPQGYPVQYPQFFPYYPVPGQYPFQQNVGYGNPFPPHNKSPYYKAGQGQYGAFPQNYNNVASNGQPQNFAAQGEDLEQSAQPAPQTTHQSKYYGQGVKGGSNVGGSEGGYKGNNYDRQRQNQPSSYYQGQGQGQSHPQGYYGQGQGQGQGQNYPRFWNQQN